MTKTAPTPTKIERSAIAEFELTPAAVAEMAKEYLKITVPEGDAKAYKLARAALTTCVTARTGTDKRRKDLGVEARVWLGEVSQAAKDLVEPLAPVEEHLRSELGKEDARKEEIKAEKAKREQERVDSIQEKIETIKSFSASLNWELSVEELNIILGNLEVLAISPDEYMEFTADANQIKTDVTVAIHKAISTREKFEAEEAARKAEDERLAKEREDLEAQKKVQAEEQERIDAEKKAQAEQQERIDAEKKRLEQEEFERKTKEDARIQAEKDAAEKIRREKREKEEQENAQAEEKARVEALKPDQEKLLAWIGTFNADNNPLPNLKSDEANKILNAIFGDLEIFLQDAMEKIKEL